MLLCTFSFLSGAASLELERTRGFFSLSLGSGAFRFLEAVFCFFSSSAILGGH
jgi:hypothetical protein